MGDIHTNNGHAIVTAEVDDSVMLLPDGDSDRWKNILWK